MSNLDNKKIMAKNIKYYMELTNKTRTDICKDLCIKYTTFTDWVNANSYPRIDKIELMANYFGIEKSDLVEDKNNIENKLSTIVELPILKYYNLLNEIGKKEAEKRVKELIYIPTYNQNQKASETIINYKYLT